VSNLLFLRRSLAYRHAALETLRKARGMMPGSERAHARQLGRALIELARTEAWLEGQTGRPLSLNFQREHQPRHALSPGA